MIQDGFGEVTERLRRWTVQVRAGRNGAGSGVLWDNGGQVVTNAHVLQGSNIEVVFWNGRRTRAQVVSKDSRRDLASLKVDADGVAAAIAGDSDALRPGEIVIAVGNPLGFIGAVSTGVVHSVGSIGGLAPGRWIVSDVRLAPGNSGGALANAAGHVIGINTMIANGLALAIPSRSVARFLNSPVSAPPRLGVTVRPVALDPKRGAIGLLILEIASESAADRASLLPGDILISAGHRSFRAVEDLEDALYAAVGGQIQIEFHRGGNRQTRKVVVPFALDPMRAA